jgi:catechol 2,3-dioxygenase
MGVMRLGYVHIRVTDLEEARDHYSNTLGMSVVHEEPGRLHLKCWDEWDHHSLVLEEGGVGLVKLGYKCSSEDDLAEFEKRCSQFGATTGRFSRGENMTVGDGVRVTLPSEHTLELFSDMEFTGTDTGSINPEAWPRDMRGVGGHWIDHALIAAEDPGLVERFFMECLDFRPAERVVESIEHPDVIGTWMTCGDSPHDLAVIKGPNAKLHHFAFHLEDWGAILRAGDIFAMDDVPIDIGPTRHGITRGTTIYFFDPSGNRNEVFAGLGYRVLAEHELDLADAAPAAPAADPVPQSCPAQRGEHGFRLPGGDLQPVGHDRHLRHVVPAFPSSSGGCHRGGPDQHRPVRLDAARLARLPSQQQWTCTVPRPSNAADTTAPGRSSVEEVNPPDSTIDPASRRSPWAASAFASHATAAAG